MARKTKPEGKKSTPRPFEQSWEFNELMTAIGELTKDMEYWQCDYKQTQVERLLFATQLVQKKLKELAQCPANKKK